jgi:hypothetical protein
VKLLPHQAAFIDTVLSPDTQRTVLLRGDLGTGKTTAMATLVGRLLQERPAARALILCPAALQFGWLDVLHNQGAPALLVNRYEFREMLDSAPGGEVWPRGRALLLSDDFAKQPDIRDSLATVRWDLVIVDEAHRFTGLRAKLLQRLAAAADKVVLATVPSIASIDALPRAEVTVIAWLRHQLVDHAGKLLDDVPRPIFHLLSFIPSEAERDLSGTIRALSQVLEASTGQHAFVGSNLLRALHSSPAALETALRRLLTTEGDADLQALMDNADEIEEEAPARVGLSLGGVGRASATRALDQLDAIRVDSKLAGLSALLGDLASKDSPPGRVCVLTDFVSTLHYLAAEFDGRHLAYSALHGGMLPSARDNSLKTFASKGGILVATRATMTEGLSLPDVTDLVLYDLPTSSITLQTALGRFDRFGRTSRLRIHALVPADDVDRTLSEQLRVLRAEV